MAFQIAARLTSHCSASFSPEIEVSGEDESV